MHKRKWHTLYCHGYVYRYKYRNSHKYSHNYGNSNNNIYLSRDFDFYKDVYVNADNDFDSD